MGGVKVQQCAFGPEVIHSACAMLRYAVLPATIPFASCLQPELLQFFIDVKSGGRELTGDAAECVIRVDAACTREWGWKGLHAAVRMSHIAPRRQDARVFRAVPKKRRASEAKRKQQKAWLGVGGGGSGSVTGTLPGVPLLT